MHSLLLNTGICLLSALPAHLSAGEVVGVKEYERLLNLLGEKPTTASIGMVASGYGAHSGQLFAAVTYSDVDLQTDTAGDDDGSIVIGLGLGDPVTSIGVESVLGITSVSTQFWGDGQFADEGNFSLKLHKMIKPIGGFDSASVSLGASNLLGWGSTKEQPTNYYASYSSRKAIGAFKQYNLGYTVGYGSASSELETSAAFYGGVGIARNGYSVSLSRLEDVTNFNVNYEIPFVDNLSVSYSRTDILDTTGSARNIVSIGYSTNIFQ